MSRGFYNYDTRGASAASQIINLERMLEARDAEIERLRAEQLPTPPEECQTEAEKKAFAFGYWSGVAAIRARGEKP